MKNFFLMIIFVLLSFNLHAFAGIDSDPIIVWPSDMSKNVLEVEAVLGTWTTRFDGQELVVRFEEGANFNTVHMTITDVTHGQCIAVAILGSVGHAYSGTVFSHSSQSMPAIVFVNASGTHVRFFIKPGVSLDLLLQRPKKFLRRGR
ncbi:hypothetical protein [Bdellovibrio sp. HCB337]|uniref:hypothetical protein n=1 Tax=Bdellovibrio sp. HCB337 TaxID=3394358 RepID=UPI0039A6AF2B